MTNPNQLNRLSLDKNLFWTGTLCLNENGGHVFFEVRVKKNVPDAPAMIGLFTCDIPPFPLSSTDTLNIAFILENNQGLSATRHTIVEASLSGTDLQAAIEANGTNDPQLLVTNETGEWQFQLLDKVWVVKNVLIYAPTATLKQHVKDL